MERRDDLFSLKHFSHLAARLSRGNGAIRLARRNFLFAKYIASPHNDVDASRHTEADTECCHFQPLLNAPPFPVITRARSPLYQKRDTYLGKMQMWSKKRYYLMESGGCIERSL